MADREHPSRIDSARTTRWDLYGNYIARRRGAGTKGRREVDTRSGQRTAPLAGKSLAGAYRPGTSARVGAL